MPQPTTSTFKVFAFAATVAVALVCATRIRPYQKSPASPFRGLATPQRLMRSPDPFNAGSSAAGRAPQIAQSYGNLPLSFEPNRGQTEREAQFTARGAADAIPEIFGSRPRAGGRHSCSKQEANG